MILNMLIYYASLEHKESVLRNLVSYSEKINSTDINLDNFADSKYPLSKSDSLMPAIYSLIDDGCIKVTENDRISLLSSAYNRLQKERLKTKDRITDGIWDLAKLILAALAGALLAKYIH